MNDQTISIRRTHQRFRINPALLNLQGLVSNGVEILSTGGTYRLLLKKNIAVARVSDPPRFPEMMDGRVKTLHTP